MNIVEKLKHKINEIGTVADLGPVPKSVLVYKGREYWDKDYAKRKKMILKYKEFLARQDKSFS